MVTPTGQARNSLSYPIMPPMQTAKEEVRKLLERIPDEATIEEIQYHLYVREKIAHGLADAQAGRALSSEEAERRMAKWLGK